MKKFVFNEEGKLEARIEDVLITLYCYDCWYQENEELGYIFTTYNSGEDYTDLKNFIDEAIKKETTSFGFVDEEYGNTIDIDLSDFEGSSLEDIVDELERTLYQLVDMQAEE